MADRNNTKDEKLITRKPSPGELHKGHRQRMKKRFNETKFDGWAKHEVIEFMLFHVFREGNTNDKAHMLLRNSGMSIARMFEIAQTDCFQKIDGIGPATVEFLRHLKAFTEYYNSAAVTEKSVRLTRDNFTEVIKRMGFSNDTEDLMVICLSPQMRIKYITSIAEVTGEDYAISKTDRLIKAAGACGASSVVLVHNHPSGCLRPSYDDMFMTAQAERMLGAIGVSLIDHYIVCGEQVVSIKMAMQDEEEDDAE